MRRVAGFSPILGAIAALIVWAVHFLLVYGVQATLCWRGLAGRTILGWPVVPALVVAATALALAATGAIFVRAWHRLGRGLSGEDGEEPPQFTVWMSLAVALLATLALVWEAIPVFFLPPC
jgi:hypothetical protein